MDASAIGKRAVILVQSASLVLWIGRRKTRKLGSAKISSDDVAVSKPIHCEQVALKQRVPQFTSEPLTQSRPPNNCLRIPLSPREQSVGVECDPSSRHLCQIRPIGSKRFCPGHVELPIDWSLIPPSNPKGIQVHEEWYRRREQVVPLIHDNVEYEAIAAFTIRSLGGARNAAQPRADGDEPQCNRRHGFDG